MENQKENILSEEDISADMLLVLLELFEEMLKNEEVFIQGLTELKSQLSLNCTVAQYYDLVEIIKVKLKSINIVMDKLDKIWETSDLE